MIREVMFTRGGINYGYFDHGLGQLAGSFYLFSLHGGLGS